ncbi:MAG: RNA polymerase sigma factor [Xanthomonadaceae bacterium]|nr:RNA polymerase sigma factor [Xanthomonadaceae bacterium]MDE1965348.1 RNA polymerase sigma factor [Xanthomonadaceae bacterium]
MRATIDASPSARGGPRTPSMPAPDPDRAPVPSSPDPAHALRVAELFREHNRALVAFLRSRLDSLADAQEVAQEAYVRLVTLERPETIDSLRAYLFRIATNLAVDRLRQRRVRTGPPVEPEPAEWHLGPLPERRVDAEDQLHRVAAALRDLPAKTAHAFVAHLIDGREIAAIAHEMRLTERMVRYHVSRALAHCRARLDEPENSR